MSQKTSRFRTVGDGSGLDRSGTFTREETVLALRNHGMLLEGLRYPITPTGMHYILVHFDVPEVDGNTARLKIGGLVARPLTLSLNDIKARPAVTMPVTMECAGNGRALMAPRPISHPWMGGGIGTAEWTGTPLAPILEEAGLNAETVDLVFTGADRGVQGDEVQFYQRSLSVDDATRDEVLLAYEMNGRPLEPQHGFPLRLLVPGWYGMTSVKWLTSIEAIDQPPATTPSRPRSRGRPPRLGPAPARLLPPGGVVPPASPPRFPAGPPPCGGAPPPRGRGGGARGGRRGGRGDSGGGGQAGGPAPAARRGGWPGGGWGREGGPGPAPPTPPPSGAGGGGGALDRRKWGTGKGGATTPVSGSTSSSKTRSPKPPAPHRLAARSRPAPPARRRPRWRCCARPRS